jgi:glutamyl-tRNA synthetase
MAGNKCFWKNDKKRPRGRLAPTPSGFLHQGNALNFVLNWWIIRFYSGELGLRIDDIDHWRCRDNFLEDIFRTLEWLKIDCDFGPSTVTEFKQKYSQGLKRDFYWTQLMRHRQHLFHCQCSRKDLLGHLDYPGTCLDNSVTGEFLKDNAIKLRGSGHPTLWRKEDIPAYHWTSLLDDQNTNISLLIRGEDLFDSGQIQRTIAQRFEVEFPEAIFHHPLIEDKNGKLSKSQKASSLREIFTTAQEFFHWFCITLNLPMIDRLEQLLELSPEQYLEFHSRTL